MIRRWASVGCLICVWGAVVPVVGFGPGHKSWMTNKGSVAEIASDDHHENIGRRLVNRRWISHFNNNNNNNHVDDPTIRSDESQNEYQWRDINIMCVTDVHSWVHGHSAQQPHGPYDVDYGHVLSLYEHWQAAAIARGQDLFFVMNGDMLDGTGLSETPPTHLLPILQHMPWHAVNVGNHELYYDASVAYLQSSGFIDHWQGNYLSSNTLVTQTNKTLGNRYTYMVGSQTGARILTFGFLYNFQNACPMTRVERVQEVVEQEWFIQVLKKRDFDAIVVLAHMDSHDFLVEVLLQAIRSIVGPVMPVQFINGHTHVRSYRRLDLAASALEAGRFLDTVGMVSFDRATSSNHHSTTIKNFRHFHDISDDHEHFSHMFIDANQQLFAKLTAFDTVDAFTTPRGRALSRLINNTRTDMGLNRVVGCAPRTLYRHTRSYNNQDSLLGYYVRHIVEELLTQHNKSIVFAQSTDSFYANIWKGPITIDNLDCMDPFVDNYTWVSQSMSASDLLSMLQYMRQHIDPFNHGMVVLHANEIHANDLSKQFALIMTSYDASKISDLFAKITGKTMSPLPVMDNSRQYNMTSRSVWLTFVERFWPCPNNNNNTVTPATTSFQDVHSNDMIRSPNRIARRGGGGGHHNSQSAAFVDGVSSTTNSGTHTRSDVHGNPNRVSDATSMSSTTLTRRNQLDHIVETWCIMIVLVGFGLAVFLRYLRREWSRQNEAADILMPLAKDSHVLPNEIRSPSIPFSSGVSSYGSMLAQDRVVKSLNANRTSVKKQEQSKRRTREKLFRMRSA